MYTLMHKNLPVVHFEINSIFPIIDKIYEVVDYNHLPLGTKQGETRLDLKRFNEWFFGRGIPKSRSGLQNALDILNVESPERLLLRSRGLSLTDHYWFCKQNNKQRWEALNYFDHEFPETVGLALFGQASAGSGKDLDAPDTASTGNLKKRWIVRNGRRLLVKSGKGPLYQEPFNEAIAALIMGNLSIPHVNYWIEWQKEEPLSVCECFINADTEFISAAQIRGMKKKNNSVSLYEHLISLYMENGLERARETIEKMIILDYIIGNRDRHLNNFGIIRDPGSLHWIEAAPVYDSGASLWNDAGVAMIMRGDEIESMPFQHSHSQQIRLVQTFEWIDFSSLRHILPEIEEILAKNTYMDTGRRKAVCSGVGRRIEGLERISTNQNQDIQEVGMKYYKESRGRKYYLRDNDIGR